MTIPSEPDLDAATVAKRIAACERAIRRANSAFFEIRRRCKHDDEYDWMNAVGNLVRSCRGCGRNTFLTNG